MKNIDRGGAMIRGKEIHHEAVAKVQEQAVAKVLMGGKLHMTITWDLRENLIDGPD